MTLVVQTSKVVAHDDKKVEKRPFIENQLGAIQIFSNNFIIMDYRNRFVNLILRSYAMRCFGGISLDPSIAYSNFIAFSHAKLGYR